MNLSSQFIAATTGSVLYCQLLLSPECFIDYALEIKMDFHFGHHLQELKWFKKFKFPPYFDFLLNLLLNFIHYMPTRHLINSFKTYNAVVCGVFIAMKYRDM